MENSVTATTATLSSGENSNGSSDIESGESTPKATIMSGIIMNPLRNSSKRTSPASPSAASSSSAEHWSDDIERILQNIRSNSEILAKHHKESYLKLQSQLVYFRVPLIIISAMNSVFSVGLNAYLEQQTVSTINCLMSLACACISSVELFLQIQKKLEIELNSYHGYYLLGTRVSAMLKLDRSHRELDGINFLNNVVNDYNNLFEQSNVDIQEFTDEFVKFEMDDFTASSLKQLKRKP